MRRDSTRGLIGADPPSNAIRGVIVAELGEHANGKARLNDESLRRIVYLMRVRPPRARFWYRPPDGPNPSASFLGFLRNPRRDGNLVRADLVFDHSAMTESLDGNMPPGRYLLAEASSEPFGLRASSFLASGRLVERNDVRGPVFMVIDLHEVDFLDDDF